MDGFWEFPGGKVKNSEKFNYAAIREIQEELNIKIDAKDINFLMNIFYEYSDFFLSMQVYFTDQWQGKIKAIEKQKFKAPIVIRSTLPVGFTTKIQQRYPDQEIIYVPEFLREGTSIYDYYNPPITVVGSSNQKSKEIICSIYNELPGELVLIDVRTAEILKYVNNSFHALKVSFANEMYGIASDIGADWDKVLEGVLSDGRIADSHLNVPGPDGKQGFGGSCFPKDINALITFCTERNISADVINAAWETNLKVRPERDWEALLGRAVSSHDE